MKLQRFFVRNKAKVGADLVVADPALSHQLGKVFRMGAGERVILFDGDGFEYVSTLASLRKDGAVFHVEESSPSIAAPSVALHIYPALIKKDKLEWVLQKATELGAASFHPIVAERSEKLGFDLKREEKIVKEAAEQSGWGRVPEIFEPEKLELALEQAENPVVLEGSAKHFSGGHSGTSAREFLERVVGAKRTSEKNSRAEVPSAQNVLRAISIFIGPEGGWSKEEKEYFSARRIPSVSLGEQTLRAETASVAAAALLLSL